MTTDTQLLADELAIRALVERYGDAVMRFDGAAWADCWAENASWTLPGAPAVTGRDNILAAWQGAMAAFDFVGFFGNFGPIQIDGDTAKATLYQQETLIGKDGSKRRIIGRYEDEHVRQGTVWRFSSRNYAVLNVEEY
ncbi:MAG: nuclear transport factor 2 family protein [Pseudomonadota bacterium]